MSLGITPTGFYFWKYVHSPVKPGFPLGSPSLYCSPMDLKTSCWGHYWDHNYISWSKRFIMKYLNCPVPHRRYSVVFMVFTVRSSAEKLIISFDLSGFRAEELAPPLLLYSLAQASAFRREVQSRLLSNLPYGVIGLRW